MSKIFPFFNYEISPNKGYVEGVSRIVANIRILCMGADMTFSEGDMPRLRKRMMTEVANKLE